MKIISKIGCGALVAAVAIWAAGCSKSGASASPAGATAANMPAPNLSAPTTSAPQNPEDKMPRVSVEEAKKLVADGKAVIVDVRGADAYKMSHIKGALDIPLTKLESGDFKGLPKDKRIIAYCG